MIERPNYHARYSSEPPSSNDYIDNTVDTTIMWGFLKCLKSEICDQQFVFTGSQNLMVLMGFPEETSGIVEVFLNFDH